MTQRDKKNSKKCSKTLLLLKKSNKTIQNGFKNKKGSSKLIFTVKKVPIVYGIRTFSRQYKFTVFTSAPLKLFLAPPCRSAQLRAWS